MIGDDDFAEVISTFRPRDESVWDTLWQNQSTGRVAVAVMPREERIAEAKKVCTGLRLAEPDRKSAHWSEQWEQALLDQVAILYAYMQLPGDFCPAMNIPLFVCGQSQGICDLFGARLESQGNDGEGNELFFVHPLSPDPQWVHALTPAPLENSLYWGAVEWIRYSRSVTKGLFNFRIPVMTGPLDTANYLLGTTTLMEWIYSEPAALHQLLDKITKVIMGMIRALREAAGGTLYPETFLCMRGGFSLGSECRSIISREHFEEFEVPYLRRIGETLGTYGIHSCGSWERTISSAIEDPNLRAMHGQVKENDLALLCQLSAGRMTFAIGPSVNLSERYTWPDMKSFYAYVLENTPATQPMEIWVAENDIPLLNKMYHNSSFWKQL